MISLLTQCPTKSTFLLCRKGVVSGETLVLNNLLEGRMVQAVEQRGRRGSSVGKDILYTHPHKMYIFVLYGGISYDQLF